EQRLDNYAETDERQELPVIAEMRLDEIVDGGEGAGGFLRGIDDEVFVLVIIELQVEFVVELIDILIAGRWRGALVADHADGGGCGLLAGRGRKAFVRLRGHLFI